MERNHYIPALLLQFDISVESYFIKSFSCLFLDIKYFMPYLHNFINYKNFINLSYG